MTKMPNSPAVRIAVVVVSRDCFPIELSRNRARQVVEACQALFDAVKLLGVHDIGVPLPKTMLYAGENPFALAR